MIIYINGRGMNAPELKAYISELEAENAELRAKVESAERQKAEYKRLLKAAVEDLSCGGENNKCTKSCNTCTHSSIKGYGCRYFGEYHWRYADEALALIGEDGEQNG